MRARGGVCRDNAPVRLPWAADAALNHGFSLGGVALPAQPWPVRLPAGTVLLSAGPLPDDSWLQPNNARDPLSLVVVFSRENNNK